jgi:hypothetical protein
MRELVTEPVWVETFNRGLQAPALHHLADAALSHRTKPAEPQRVSGRSKGMFCPSPEIPTECLSRSIAEWSCTLAPTLAQNERNVLLEIKMLQLDADQLGNPQARVEQEAEDRRISPGIKVVTFARVKEPGDLIGSKKRHRLLRHSGRAHLDEGRLRDLLLQLKPAKELLKTAVVPCNSRS